MGFVSFLLARDILGHPLSVNYKGQNKFNTKLGAFLSIGIRTLVLVQLVQLAIEMFYMTDPDVFSFSRPLYGSEVDDFGEVNLHENRFNFGIYFETV